MPKKLDKERRDPDLDQIDSCNQIKNCMLKMIKKKQLGNDHGLDWNSVKTGFYFCIW